MPEGAVSVVAGVERLETSHGPLFAVIGASDAAFGHARRGTADALALLGDKEGFDVVVVPPFAVDDRPVSSSELRRRVTTGDLDGAAVLLGRPYSIVATAGEDGLLDVAMPV